MPEPGGGGPRAPLSAVDGFGRTAREEKLRARDAKLKHDADDARMAALYRQHVLGEKLPEGGFVSLDSLGAKPAAKVEEHTEEVMGD